MLNIFIFLYKKIFFLFKKEKYSHKWRKDSAHKILKRLDTLNEAQIFVYLRKIDPFTMEELILTALEKREDIKIERNTKYTGDGGVDGRFYLLNKNRKPLKCIIQAKRYSSLINPKHLKEFANQINQENAYLGFFIHTGRTSKNSFAYAKSINNLRIISGQRLIKLIKFGAID
ncbi:restriction endonuclease [Arcobacter defluvii]|uniref:Type IV methyl-directed restriction enzyme Mrr n=1 Tax=Arcobacter defluvii TaxID=873191 RepID=A0AAE7E7Q5_9BACT|nr:restriction endonuclease [Arcobacter defluvii]QKF77287.1 putative type IV methyl-directed restriction enzyme Mrr [Arcobacter defluvii]QKF77869.1 putative type IV methyl-directed restriction enzyme Mrr [Arcobacter defluvii]RXI32650.1 restriction endonuclease [Arcobacter defluvii]